MFLLFMPLPKLFSASGSHFTHMKMSSTKMIRVLAISL